MSEKNLYKEFKLDNICDFIGEFHDICQDLYDLMSESFSSETIVQEENIDILRISWADLTADDLEPKRLKGHIEYLENVYKKLSEDILLIEPKLKKYMSKEVFIENEDIEDDLIKNCLRSMESFLNLSKMYNTAYGHCGVSEHSATDSLIVEWKREFCKNAPEIISASKKLLRYMHLCDERIQFNEVFLPNYIDSLITEVEEKFK